MPRAQFDEYVLRILHAAGLEILVAFANTLCRFGVIPLFPSEELRQCSSRILIVAFGVRREFQEAFGFQRDRAHGR